MDHLDQFGRLERVNVRDGFKDEAQDFTPWLARNLDRLGEQLGLALELRETEHPVGRYALDILANDVTGRLVVVENQLGQSDHDHLGKLLTYAAGTDCRVVIWIATSFSAEHIAAFEWLNRTTTAEVGFYAVQVELLRIGDSALAPYFQPLVRPNEVAKAANITRQVTDWGWATYDSDLHLPMHRIALAKRVVDGLTAAIKAYQRPWQVKFRKGYVAFQRAGGYNVMVVDLVRNRPVRLAIKLPSGQDPDSLELTNLLPQLPVVWDASAHEWGWHIESAEDVPNPESVVGMADRYAVGASDESSEEG
ncbi:MAG: hypothetical protein ACRDPY_10725 [Streptosporangiaceae bacterium]